MGGSYCLRSSIIRWLFASLLVILNRRWCGNHAKPCHLLLYYTDISSTYVLCVLWRINHRTAHRGGGGIIARADTKILSLIPDDRKTSALSYWETQTLRYKQAHAHSHSLSHTHTHTCTTLPTLLLWVWLPYLGAPTEVATPLQMRRG